MRILIIHLEGKAKDICLVLIVPIIFILGCKLLPTLSVRVQSDYIFLLPYVFYRLSFFAFFFKYLEEQ